MPKYDCLLLDGNNTAFKAISVHENFTAKVETKNGVEIVGTGMLYGFIHQVLSIVKDRMIDNPEIFVCWDRHPKRREDIFIAHRDKVKGWENETYKGNRERNPEDPKYIEFAKQKKLLLKCIPYLGLTQAWKDCEEADDIIGTLSRIKSDQGKKVLIASSDHDMHQLITENVHQYSSKKIYDPKMFREELAIAPQRYTDVMSLTGDKGDNIPGIKGIGEKIAVQLIKDNDELLDTIIYTSNTEDVINYLKGIKATQAKKELLIQNIETVRLANKLVKIKTDIKGIKYKKGNKDIVKIKHYLEMLSMFSLISDDQWFEVILRL